MFTRCVYKMVYDARCVYDDEIPIYHMETTAKQPQNNLKSNVCRKQHTNLCREHNIYNNPCRLRSSYVLLLYTFPASSSNSSSASCFHVPTSRAWCIVWKLVCVCVCVVCLERVCVLCVERVCVLCVEECGCVVCGKSVCVCMQFVGAGAWPNTFAPETPHYTNTNLHQHRYTTTTTPPNYTTTPTHTLMASHSARASSILVISKKSFVFGIPSAFIPLMCCHSVKCFSKSRRPL